MEINILLRIIQELGCVTTDELLLSFLSYFDDIIIGPFKSITSGSQGITPDGTRVLIQNHFRIGHSLQ